MSRRFERVTAIRTEIGIATTLTWLANQVATGELDPQISWRGNWKSAADAVEALVGRRLHGKAVLEVS